MKLKRLFVQEYNFLSQKIASYDFQIMMYNGLIFNINTKDVKARGVSKHYMWFKDNKGIMVALDLNRIEAYQYKEKTK